MNKEKRKALWNLKITGWFFLIFGFFALLGITLFWSEKNSLKNLLNLGFGLGMCFFGWLILSSRKVLA